MDVGDISSQRLMDPLLQKVRKVDKNKRMELLAAYLTLVASMNLSFGYPVMLIIYCIVCLKDLNKNVDVKGVMNLAEDFEESSGPDSLESLKQSDEEKELRDRTLSLLPAQYRPARLVTGVNNNPPDPRGQTGDSNTIIWSGNSTNTNIASGNSTNTDVASGNSTNTNSLEHTGFLLPFTRPEANTTVRNSLSHEIADGFINSNSSSKPSNDIFAKSCLAALERRFMAVKNENNLLEKNMRCVHCGRNPRGVTFLPCGHFTTCKNCSGPIHACNLCNKNILATVDTYLS